MSCLIYAEFGKQTPKPRFKIKKNMPFGVDDAIAVVGAATKVAEAAGGFVTNYKKQRKSQQKLNAWNFENITKPQMALQNQYQIDAENRANAYNDPSAQRARLKAAGISPYQAVSDAGVQGSVSSAPTAALAGGSAGTKDYSNALGKLDIAGMLNAIRETSANVELKKAQAREANTRADEMEGNTIPAQDLQALRVAQTNEAIERGKLASQKAKTEYQRTFVEEQNVIEKRRLNMIGDATVTEQINAIKDNARQIKNTADSLYETILSQRFQNSLQPIQRQQAIENLNNTIRQGVYLDVQSQLAAVGVKKSLAEIQYICVNSDKAKAEIDKLIAEKGLTEEKAEDIRKTRGVRKFKMITGAIKDCADSVATTVNAFKPGVTVNHSHSSSNPWDYDSNITYAD